MSKTKNKKVLIILAGILLLVMVIVGVKRTVFADFDKKGKVSAAPTVELATVIEKDIYDTMGSTGRIEAKYAVNVVARVQGWLKRSYFTEGDKVAKGALLFQIEPDNYEIAVNQAKANLASAEADYINAQKDLERSEELVKLDYVSKSYNDQAIAKRDITKAAVAAAKATLADAQLKLSYTKIYSPVAGKIGKILITQGNLVDTTSGAIARVVSTDPIYAYFTVKSEDYLNFQRSSEKNIKDSSVTLTLADGTEYPIKGKVEFIDNEVDPTVGTIGLRATFANPDDMLVPSDYVTVKITAQKPRHVVLVPQEAVQESKNGMFAYTLDAENQAVVTPVVTDGEYEGQWIVEKGLKAGDKVVSKGLLSIRRPGMKVNVAEPAPVATEAPKTQVKQEAEKKEDKSNRE